MRIKPGKDKNQWFLSPCIGIIDERGYYGYKVFAIAFAWFRWRLKVEFGVKPYVKRKDKKEG